MDLRGEVTVFKIQTLVSLCGTQEHINFQYMGDYRHLLARDKYIGYMQSNTRAPEYNGYATLLEELNKSRQN